MLVLTPVLILAGVVLANSEGKSNTMAVTINP